LATTKFEATFARQAFPCFDEPGFKANFSVTLVRPSEGFIALSNMNQEVNMIVIHLNLMQKCNDDTNFIFIYFIVGRNKGFTFTRGDYC
jgi:hypothetical protein